MGERSGLNLSGALGQDALKLGGRPYRPKNSKRKRPPPPGVLRDYPQGLQVCAGRVP